MRGQAYTQEKSSWQRYGPWASPSIRSSARSTLGFMLVFTILWNLMAVPLALVVMIGFGQNPGALIVLLFPLIGAALILLTYRQTVRWRRFGYTPLQMDPYPGAIGGQVGGIIDIPLTCNPDLLFKVSLRCVLNDERGSGKQRRHHEKLLWQSHGLAHSRDHDGKTRLEILFNVDAGLPPSELANKPRYHSWSLRVRGEGFDRSYEIPVFPGDASARNLQTLSTEHSQAVADRLAVIESVLDLQQIPGGVEIFYPAFHRPLPKVLGIIMGCVAFAAGIAACVIAGAALIPSMSVSLAGVVLAARSFYSLSVSMKVRLDEHGLTREKFLLGRRIASKQVQRQELRGLSRSQSSNVQSASVQSASVQSGKADSIHFVLRALTRSNKTIRISHKLSDREVAEQLLEAVSLLTGIPVVKES